MAVAGAERGWPKARTAVRRISVLGSTGSVGCSTLDLVGRNAERFAVVALTAHRNVSLLIEQAKRFRPERAVIADPELYEVLKSGLAGTGIEAAAGESAVVEAAGMPADWIMAAIVGAAGLRPTLAAVRLGTHVALANKECLVTAGPLFLREVAAAGAVLLPVDSEHNAIFQVLDRNQYEAIEKIILTASGGPFRTWSIDRMRAATPAEAIAHPKWDMGPKISVDSATLMNKGLELIEAHYLFPVGHDRLEVVIHPQSIVHSLVAYSDGSVLAQLGAPDMRTPIAYAMSWPDRMATPTARLNLAEIASLTFEEPDFKRFPALKLAQEALRMGGAAPTILNAANEVAVGAFLAEKLGFLDIPSVVRRTLDRAMSEGDVTAAPADLREVSEIDQWSRQIAGELISSR